MSDSDAADRLRSALAMSSALLDLMIAERDTAFARVSELAEAIDLHKLRSERASILTLADRDLWAVLESDSPGGTE